MKLLNIPIEVSYEEDVYIAKCSSIQWAFAQWDTPEEAIQELIDVIQMIQEFRKEQKILEDYTVQTNKYFTTLPVLTHD